MSVTTYGAKVSPGLSFAVPVDDLIKIVPSLITLHQVS
jgi:S1-C subfamily serine protease